MTTPTHQEALENVKKQYLDTQTRIAQLYQELHQTERQRDMLANVLQGAEFGAKAQAAIHEAEEAARNAEQEVAEGVSNENVTLTAKASKKV